MPTALENIHRGALIPRPVPGGRESPCGPDGVPSLPSGSGGDPSFGGKVGALHRDWWADTSCRSDWAGYSQNGDWAHP